MGTRSARLLTATVPLALLAACGTAAIPAASAQPATRQGSAEGGTAVAAAAARLPVRTQPTATSVTTGTTVPGAPNCPMFPASNVWNTDISQLPVDAHSAAWLRSMDSSSTNLHPDFGPNSGGFPFGIPYNIVSPNSGRASAKQC